MCNPVLIASAAMTAAGTASQMASQRAAGKAVNQAIQTNNDKQNQLIAQNQDSVQNTAAKFAQPAFNANTDAATASLAQKFTAPQVQGASLPGEYYGTNAPQNVKNFQDAQNTKYDAYTQQQAKALAALRGFGQGMIGNNQAIQGSNAAVQKNANFMQGNAAVLPIEVEAAKRKAINPVADIMSALGEAGMTAGMMSSAGMVAPSGSFMQGPLQPGVARSFVPSPSGTFGAFRNWSLGV